MCFDKNTTQHEFEQEDLMSQLIQAKRDLEIAENNFNMCDPEFFEIANSELTLAQQRVDTITKKLHKIGDDSINFTIIR